MAAAGAEDGDPLLTVDVVRAFMLSKGGEIHNHELVAHFRNFLNDPKRKAANRQKIKDFVNTLAVVKLGPGGDKVLTLRKKFREGGNFGGDPFPAQKEDVSSKTGQPTKKEKKEGKASATMKDTKDTSKKSQSCDDLTDKNVAFEDKDDYVLVTKAEGRSKSVEELDDQKAINPFVSPEVSQEFEISHDSLVSPIEEEPPADVVTMAVGPGTEKLEKAKEEPGSEDNTEKLSVDQPDAVRKQSSHSQNGSSTPKLDPVAEEPTSGGLRVKDLARNLNQIESESHSQVRPLAPKNKRESRKPVQNDDGGADYGITFTELDRDWLMAAAKCEYLTMHKMLQTNPELARKRDFITGYAPLHWAAKHGKEDVVKLLCGNSADVNVRTRGGYTPLHLAVMQNHSSVAELLVIVYGADTNIRDYNGKKAKQCMHKSATANLSSLLSRRPNNLVPESPSSISANSMVGKALFLGLNAVGGLRVSASGKENAPIPKPMVQEDHFLMPPPRDLPPVAQKAKPVARQKGTHSDSEMPSPILERSLHGSDSSPNFGTEV